MLELKNTNIIIDSTILFSHLTALVNFEENVAENFSYERLNDSKTQ